MSNTPDDLKEVPQEAVKLAADILNASRENESSLERSRSALMARMMDDPPGKKFTIAMADQVLRMRRPARAAQRMSSLVEEFGVPKYFGGFDRFGLWAGNMAAGIAPGMIMPFVKSKVRKDSQHVIISAEKAEFEKYLKDRRQKGIRVNFNQLGEAVLGDKEADNRLNQYLKRLKEPGIDYCSVKLSSVVSQISLVGYKETLESIKTRLRMIYDAAIEGGNAKVSDRARTGPKFVNLDMEEYRDLHLTVDIFQAVLDEPAYDSMEAGIVLQAYLPDSYEVLKSLMAWARARHARTGAGIKIRLVKGANLAMEQVEASLHHWEQAPYYNKSDVDANYKRMLEFAARPENAQIVRVGVASHNLFDVAFALLVSRKRNVTDFIEFEMLEGMANAQAEEVRERTGGLIVYSPVCFDHEFESAVAYLVRRLDENTAPGSFLGALFALKEGTPEWSEQRDNFLTACERAFSPELSAVPNRKQNRLTESPELDSGDKPFQNVADTDFSLPENRQWAVEIAQKWKDHQPNPVPIQFGGNEVVEGRLTGKGKDPSRPGYEAYQFAQGTQDDLEVALQTAVKAQPAWEQLGVQGRATLLRRAAQTMAKHRGDTIGAMMLDAGKTITEADVEISEAIDFANYYSRSLDNDAWQDGSKGRAIGVVAVIPPWNFPFAIPAGGVLAALMAGNSVVLKPARESVLTAWQLVTQLWEAGIPKDVLQFLPLTSGAVGKLLVTDSRIAAVILTGSYFTAAMFQEWRPDLRLLAETSGKNSMVISIAADIDLAIKDLVRGAFGHAGQKCSATSLALVQKEVYDNPRFMEQLKDAAESLRVAGSWDTSAIVTPVIREPDEYLTRGLNQLEAGESWLLEPQMVDNNPCLWRPGIRIGVKPGSWYHTNECFGPVLGIIRVNNFEEAIDIQNSSDFGLTGGVHSLDPKEIELWREKVEVGNAYINRGTTGAIVQRQPFGGWKDSCVGPGPKAGGPNYVAAFCDWSDGEPPKTVARPSQKTAELLEWLTSAGLSKEQLAHLTNMAGSCAHWWEKEFSIEHDPSQVHGETNHFRYRSRAWHVLRINEGMDSMLETAARVAIACVTTGTQFQISCEKSVLWADQLCSHLGGKLYIESNEQLAKRLANMKGGTLRIVGAYDPHCFAPAVIGNIPIVRSEVLANGRIELTNYLREQSISETVHRYGNII